MSDFLFSPVFDPCRHHIDQILSAGWTWEEIRSFKGADNAKLDAFFNSQEQFGIWPSLGSSLEERLATWFQLVDAKRLAAEATQQATRQIVVLGKEETEPDIRVPQSAKSAWQLYKNKLLGNNWTEDAVRNIEESSLKIARRLRKSTSGKAAVRGLVVGHVQSGKTASMVGLSAMAADQGWNLIIVLSGTLENLRRQTAGRFVEDLQKLSGNLQWIPIEHPAKDMIPGLRAQSMHFNSASSSRHLIVSLKNAARLSDLCAWLTADKNSLAQMRILILDDEADQGGINTAPSDAERTRINSLIIKLTNVKALAVNYVAYTATPAANFLNEGPTDGLYPEDFIVALNQSSEHFGAVQIFGAREYDQEPLGITCKIDSASLAAVHDLQLDCHSPLPKSLEDSVLWFLCSAAAMRVFEIKKPVSMLVHTSQQQIHHANVTAGIERFLAECRSEPLDFRDRCNEVWKRIGSMLSMDEFVERFPTYGRIQYLRDYPDFNELVPHLENLIAEVSAIRLNEENGLTYHRGVHVCIDNCANNGINDENEIRRLFYPDASNPSAPDYATAFIVIGGSTLSRGLTIENLVSTYFLRASIQADSLMQMGRWFGYRKGYELLPRIWMPTETRKKFEFMTLAEIELREDLRQFSEGGVSPAHFGPRVRVHPRASWLRPTSKNRMQASIGANYDFSGVNRQTTVFHSNLNKDALQANIEVTEQFIGALGRPGKPSPRKNALVWDSVKFSDIALYLQKFRFHERAQFFSEIGLFIRWCEENLEEAGYADWNVVVAGKQQPDGPDQTWILPGGPVYKVTRTRVLDASDEHSISIGVLREPLDLLADAPEFVDVAGKTQNQYIVDKRRQLGLGKVPLLLIYRVDKASEPTLREDPLKERKPERGPLNVDDDLIGISIWLPRAGKIDHNYITHLTVRIPSELAADNDDIEV